MEDLNQQAEEFNPPEELDPIDEDELLQMLQEEHRKAIGIEDSEIPDQRASAMERYLGVPYSDELAPVEGRSSVNSRDITDAVEWAMPQLVDIFFGGDQVVELDPHSADDVQAAKLESKWLNNVFLHQNNGFLEGHQFIKDALLQKDGYIKAWAEEEVDSELEEYVGLSEPELLTLLSDPSVELVGRSEREVGMPTPEGLVPMIAYDVEVKRYSPDRKLKVKAIPPEEIKVSRRTRHNLQESPYVCHDEEYSESDLEKLLVSLGSEYSARECFETSGSSVDLTGSPERIARHKADSSHVEYVSDPKYVVVSEEYILADIDGDKYDERVKCIRVGNKLLHVEPHPLVPVAKASAILLSHKHNGMSLADLVDDIARIKTSLTRNILDNIYQQTNHRYAVVDGQVNMDDLLVNRPGGVVRETISGAVRPMLAPQLPPQAFELLGYFDQVRDERTGISKVSQGLDPNALSSNVAAGAVNQVMTAAQQRMKLIARVLAEGFRQVFWILHELSRTQITGMQKFAIDGQVQELDPTRFKKRTDLSIRVGLGTAERDAQLQRMNMIGQDMQLIAQNGGSGRILQESNVYALAVEKARIAGIKDPERYYTDPAALPPPEQQPSQGEIAMQLEQMKGQFRIQEKQLEIESDERIEVERLKVRMEELRLKEIEIAAEIEIEKAQGRGAEIG